MAAAKTSDYTLHNRATLVKGGKPYFDLLEELIRGAQEQIVFQTYIFDEGVTGMRISEALTEAALRGIKVFVLLDGFASQGLSTEFILHWRSAGVVFRYFQSLLKSRRFYLGRRLHHKVLVVDGAHALIGGINVSDRYNDLPGQEAWLDWAALLEGECVREVHAVCAPRALHGMFSKKGHLPLPKAATIATRCRVRIRVNDWVRGKMQISRSYLEMLRSARTEIIMMSSYFMPGRDLRRQLRRARSRGVTVKLILTGVSDVKLAKLAERYLYPWLLHIGVEIYEYQRSVLHGKISTMDGEWATVGSYNLNELSARASVELNADVWNDAFANEVCQRLEDVIKKDCLRINEKDNTVRGYFNRVAYLTAFQIFRLILFLFTFYFKQHKRR